MGSSHSAAKPPKNPEKEYGIRNQKNSLPQDPHRRFSVDAETSMSNARLKDVEDWRRKNASDRDKPSRRVSFDEDSLEGEKEEGFSQNKYQSEGLIPAKSSKKDPEPRAAKPTPIKKDPAYGIPPKPIPNDSVSIMPKPTTSDFETSSVQAIPPSPRVRSALKKDPSELEPLDEEDGPFCDEEEETPKVSRTATANSCSTEDSEEENDDEDECVSYPKPEKSETQQCTPCVPAANPCAAVASGQFTPCSREPSQQGVACPFYNPCRIPFSPCPALQPPCQPRENFCQTEPAKRASKKKVHLKPCDKPDDDADAEEEGEEEADGDNISAGTEDDVSEDGRENNSPPPTATCSRQPDGGATKKVRIITRRMPASQGNCYAGQGAQRTYPGGSSYCSASNFPYPYGYQQQYPYNYRPGYYQYPYQQQQQYYPYQYQYPYGNYGGYQNYGYYPYRYY